MTAKRLLWRPVKGEKDMDKLDEADRKRLAACLDTDGCLAAVRTANGSCYPVFEFGGNTELPLKLAKKYGGTIHKNKRAGKYKNEPGRIMWNYKWKIAEQNLLKEFLDQVNPYVLSKNEQVDTALEMLNVLKQKPDGWKEKANKLKAKMGQLNKNSYRIGEVDFDEYFKA
jgi:hypothetical protein